MRGRRSRRARQNLGTQEKGKRASQEKEFSSDGIWKDWKGRRVVGNKSMYVKGVKDLLELIAGRNRW